MRWLLPSALSALLFCLAVPGVRTAHAAPAVPIVFGTTWDGPSNSLQHIVDTYIGTPGAIDVHADFVGAHAGDQDPWFWVGSSFPALMVTEIAGHANTNELGWYRETFATPALDGVDDGVVFTGTQGNGSSTIITFPSGTSKFGFYLDTHQTIATPSGARNQVFFTNRMLNDIGPNGYAATHAPFDGDAQAIVFDVSAWKGPNTWLVCFEDVDSGFPVQPAWGAQATDNDFNDLVFVVTAFGATPTRTLTFGALKAQYR
jgi:hypothetical protein